MNPYELKTAADVRRLFEAFNGHCTCKAEGEFVDEWKFPSWQDASKADTLLNVLTDKCSKGPVRRYEYDSMNTQIQVVYHEIVR